MTGEVEAPRAASADGRGATVSRLRDIVLKADQRLDTKAARVGLWAHDFV